MLADNSVIAIVTDETLKMSLDYAIMCTCHMSDLGKTELRLTVLEDVVASGSVGAHEPELIFF